MGWTSAFIDGLSTQKARMFLFEVVRMNNEPGIPGFKMASHAGLSGDDSAQISGVEMAGQSVRPQSWTSVVGAFDVCFVGNPNDVLNNIRRGSTIQLRMGFPGWSASAFEPIALGRVTKITRSGRPMEWCISCLDAISATSYQIDTNAVDGLFGNLALTTLTADSAVADALYDGTAFGSFQRETGSNGAVLVTPSGGDPYFRLWSGSTATTLTIASPGTASLMGTTDVGASSSNVIACVAYMTAHPLTVARRVLLSTGAGTNGSYDTYPSGWSLGIGQQYCDEIDMDRVLTIVQPASGSYIIEVAQTDAVDDPRAWLESTVLAPFGLFLAMRQGLITIRAAQDPTSALSYTSGFELTIQDLIDVESMDHEDPDAGAEYAFVTAISGGTFYTSSSTVPATLPAYDKVIIDLSTCLFSNLTPILTEVVGRLGLYYTTIAEVVRLKVRLRAAQVAVGDIITITLGAPWIYSRRDGAKGYEGRRAVVLFLQPDYWRAYCTITLAVYPYDEGAFG